MTDSNSNAPLVRSSWAVRGLRILLMPLLVLATVPLIVTELGYSTLYNLVGSAIPDVVYLSHGAFGLAQGHIPYSAHFMTYPDQGITYLYPPLTLLLTLPPVIAGAHYDAGFSVEVLLLVVVGASWLGSAAGRHGIVAPLGLLALVLLLAAGPTLLTRLDGIQGLLIAASALALMGGRRAVAVLLVGLAVLIKETAILAAVPVVLWVLLPEAPSDRPIRRRLEEVAAGLAIPAVLFLVFAVWSGGAEISATLSSVHRGLEIESLPASVAIAFSHLVPVHPYLGHLASWQLRAPDAGILAGIFSVSGAIFVLAGSFAFARSHLRPATAVAFAVAVGLCATPVLSPQYLLDLLPVLALAACAEFSSRRAAGLLLLGLALALLTQAEFPYLFDSLTKLQPVGVALILSRNLVLVIVVVLMAMRLPLPRHRATPPLAPSSG